MHEVPHNIYIQNYSTASATCLALRRWLFSPQVELLLARDDLISAYLFWQTVDEVNRGHVMAGENLYQLKAMQDINRRTEVFQSIWSSSRMDLKMKCLFLIVSI